MRETKLKRLEAIWWKVNTCAAILCIFPWILTAIPHWLGYAPHFAFSLTRGQILYGGSSFLVFWLCFAVIPHFWSNESRGWYFLGLAICLLLGMQGVFQLANVVRVASGSLDDLVRTIAMIFCLFGPAAMWIFKRAAPVTPREPVSSPAAS
jgi:hypothetical protein